MDEMYRTTSTPMPILECGQTVIKRSFVTAASGTR
jgi:hypothetical protein